MFDRWFRLDPEAALAAVHRLDDAWRKANRSTGELLATVARVRPKLVLESQLKDAGISYLSRPVEVALETLAVEDAPAARKFLLQIEEPAVRRSAEIVIEKRLAKIDPLGAVAAAKSLKENSLYYYALEAAKAEGPGILRQVIATIGSEYNTSYYIPWLILKDPEAVVDLARASDAQMYNDHVTALARQTPRQLRQAS